MPRRHRPEATSLWLAAIVLAGLVLRLTSLGNSLFGDELSTYSIVSGHGPGQILHILDGNSVDLTPPLFFEVEWLVTRIGVGPEQLRLISLLAGVASILMTYRLGLRTLGCQAGLVGALLMALSPFLIFYSTEARAYALAMALVLGCTLCLLNALQDDSKRWWAGYAVLSCGALYCHYTVVFVLAAQALWAAITRADRRRGLLGANLAAALGFVPWLSAFFKNRGSFGTQVFNIVDPFGVHSVARDIAHWAIGHPFLPFRTEPGAVAIALIALALVGGLVALSRARPGPMTAASVLPALLAVATPAGLALYSMLGTSAWDVRNLIVSSPGLALVAGWLVTRPVGWPRPVLTGLLGLGFALGAMGLLSANHQRPDYAAAAAYIVAHGSRHDPVAIVPAPTPGPLTAMDAALTFAGQPGRALLRIGSAQLPAVLRARPYAFLPPTPAATLAAATAGGDGRLFVLAPGQASVSALLRSRTINGARVLGPIFGTGPGGRLYVTVFAPLSAYLRAIDRRYAPIKTIRFSGFLKLSLYVFARRTPLGLPAR